jgi:hypothetical protein
MVAVLAVLIVLILSLAIVRVATVGLTLTGLSKDLAHFQALSAFTGSGFTTKESEQIVNHPVRRRIAMHLMMAGHAGIAVGISSVILSFLNTGGGDWSSFVVIRLVVLLAGILLLFFIANSSYVERVTWKANMWALQRWTHIQVHDYTRLLRLSQDYFVSELLVRSDDWLAGRTLSESKLNLEGVLVLGIEHPDGSYIGAPRGDASIEAGDNLIVYGRQEALQDLDTRRADMIGNLQHVMAVTRQLDVLDEEKQIHSTNRRSAADVETSSG